MKTLGQRIREIREERDFSLRELAKKLGVSAPFLSDVELGRRNPTDKILQGIAKELGITFDELQAFDTRPPIEDMKRLAHANPQYGLAFRRVIDKNISPEDLIKFA
ncbi:MAG: helix-turn-helix transcriptional regulator [Smithella sp.]